MFSRRGFIRLTTASAGSLALRPFGLLPALAQSASNYRALVCVFLFGGNDSNNTVLPMDDTSYNAYTSIRGSLALTAADLTPTVYSTANAPYAFHGKLSELASLFSSKELAVVANVGSLVQPLTRAQYQSQQAPLPTNLFSHSDQQLQWQTSVAQGNSPTGWAGRVADYVEAQKLNTSTFPVFFSVAGNALLGNGVTTQPVAVAPGATLQLTGFTSSAASQARYNALTSLLTADSGISLTQAANATLANSLTDAANLSQALAKGSALKTVFPTTSLGQQLQQVAEIIQVASYLGMNRQIFFCSLGGFDTHGGQLQTHDTLYPQLSQAISAFYSATEELGVADSVTTFTESDFSRTFQPTTINGSDHAWGSHHMVVGGAVQGGQIYGAFPAFQLGGPNDTDTRGRWIPTTAIDQYGATLASWFGIPATALPSVFPNFANFGSQKLGFLG
ncbi:MAG TPA: DUF1501 domain-containing protein [Bryobacteraceae bacterium]|jgi:uncharacterized protein (DUF1501 family)|nr:DUF1501 domain-containing protein [Bryobacteraceae bacterium]